MSGSKRSVLVSRNYNAAPDYCARVLELLLKKPVRKEGRPDDAKERSMDDSSAIQKYTR